MTSKNVHTGYNAGRRPYHAPIAKLVADRLPVGGSYVDVGCGLGWLAKMVQELRPDVSIDAGDSDPECVRLTTERAPTAEGFLVDLAQAGWSQHMPRPGYDVVTLSHVLEDTFEPMSVVREMVSLIAPGGCAIVAVPNPSRPTILLGNLRRHHYANRGHVYSWDPSHWRRFLQQACGLQGVTFPVHTLMLPKDREWPGLLRQFPWWSLSNIAVVPYQDSPPAPR